MNARVARILIVAVAAATFCAAACGTASAAEPPAAKAPASDAFAWVKSLTIPGPEGWELISLEGDGELATYGARKSAKRVGAIATVSLRVEFQKTQVPQSSVAVAEFDCAKNTMKLLSSTGYSKRDLQGKIGTHSEPVDPLPIRPGTMPAAFHAWACGTSGSINN
ncbi:MAG TPA: surface-adhesin E family protein [Steroidobacteraceae bacterium]|nr:surface-adhesin E family protein [Steroidobacteraceae bacterium]